MIRAAGIKINVSTHQQQYVAGDLVEGLVQLDVAAKHAEGISAEMLTLKFRGHAKTVVPYESGGGKHGENKTTNFARATEELVSCDVQLASFAGIAACGTHVIPFSVMLPPGLPSSMKAIRGQGSCEIVYEFKARLHRRGMFNFDAKGDATIAVFAQREEVAATPVTIGPEVQNVRLCCCFKKGTMSIGFEAERSVATMNEPLGVTVVARNGSSCEVEAVFVKIKEVIAWRAQNHSQSLTRTVASIIVPGSQLGDLQRAAEKGGNRGRDPAAVADATRRDLQEMLVSGAGTKYNLVVPQGCNTTMKIGILEVTHTLSVKLKTPTFISSPEVGIPLRVQQSAGGLEQPNPAQFVPSSTQEALHYGG